MDMNRITYPDSLDAIEVKVIYHMLIQRLLNNQHQMLVQIFKCSTLMMHLNKNGF